MGSAQDNTYISHYKLGLPIVQFQSNYTIETQFNSKIWLKINFSNISETRRHSNIKYSKPFAFILFYTYLPPISNFPTHFQFLTSRGSSMVPVPSTPMQFLSRSVLPFVCWGVAGDERIQAYGLEKKHCEPSFSHEIQKHCSSAMSCVLAGEPSLCYVHEGDGVCESFEKKSSITDCGLYTPKGHLDQWAAQAHSPYEDTKQCPAALVTGEPHSVVS